MHGLQDSTLYVIVVSMIVHVCMIGRHLCIL
jgi:hypothetical protein